MEIPSTTKEWETFVKERQGPLKAWARLCALEECFMCSKGYPSGVVKKMPQDTVTPLMDRIDGEFLFHLFSTHGIAPEDFYDIFMKTAHGRGGTLLP